MKFGRDLLVLPSDNRGFEIRVCTSNGEYYTALLLNDDSYRLVEYIQDINYARKNRTTQPTQETANPVT